MPISQETIKNINQFSNPYLRVIYAYLFRHPRIKQIFFSTKTAQTIYNIGQQYNFSPQQQRILSGTVGLVLLGRLRPQQLSQYIVQKCNININIANQISKQVYNSIIKPVENFIDYQKDKQQTQAQTTVLQAPQQASSTQPQTTQNQHTPAQPQSSQISYHPQNNLKEKANNQEIKQQLSQHGIVIEQEEY